MSLSHTSPRARHALKKDCFLKLGSAKSGPTPPPGCDAMPDEVFRDNLRRAREAQAEVWAEETKEITDAQLLTHEEIGRARLQMQSRQWLAGKFNAQFSDRPQTQIAIGVNVTLPEQERVKLIKRRDQALLANAKRTQSDNIRQ